MTALKKYQKLECLGLWRQTPHDHRREVHVRFGEATLILIDPKSGIALSHWSLPAIQRLNPGSTPPIYHPGTDAGESLEIADDDMVAALAAVRHAVDAATVRPGRLRRVILVTTAIALIAGGVLWLPDAVSTHTASVVPAAQRAEIGQRALDDLARLTGEPCTNPLGLRALARLSERIFGPLDTPILYVAPEGLEVPVHFPGDVIVLPRRLIVQAEGPEAAAGAALVEHLRAKQQDPLLPMLRYAGLRETLHLLATAELSDSAIAGYGEALIRAQPLDLSDETLVLAFRSAQIPSSPYALAADPGGAPLQGLIDADPYRGLAPSPLIPDEDWLSLQAICES